MIQVKQLSMHLVFSLCKLSMKVMPRPPAEAAVVQLPDALTDAFKLLNSIAFSLMKLSLNLISSPYHSRSCLCFYRQLVEKMSVISFSLFYLTSRTLTKAEVHLTLRPFALGVIDAAITSPQLEQRSIYIWPRPHLRSDRHISCSILI